MPAMQLARRRLAAIGRVGGQRGQFQERRARIEQFLDAFARAAACPACARRSRSRCGRAWRAASCLARNSAASARLCAALRRNSALAALRADRIGRIGSGSAGRGFEARDDLVLVERVSPTPRASAARTPSRGEGSDNCSFMLSMVTTVSPRATASPGAFSTATTVRAWAHRISSSVPIAASSAAADAGANS